MLSDFSLDPNLKIDTKTPDHKVMKRRLIEKERDRLISARIGISPGDLTRIFGAKKFLG